MTGTPLENNLGELWTQFDWLLPGLLGGPRAFQRQFRAPVEKRHDARALERLKHRVAPFFLRRTKDQVASELPPKTEVPVPVTLGGAQRDLYETVRVSVANGLRSAISEQGVERSRILVLDALLKLRQVCCDPRLTSLVEAERNIESAKLERLLQLLEQAVAEGRRILVFSQFVRMLVLIADEIKAREWPYLMLTGETRDRGAVVDAFQRGEAPILLMSLKAGGVGLNLTAADVVIHYDPWWNPAAEAQASDRAHRIGQDKPVFVYRLIAEGTVEERIQALQGEKQHLADALFGDTGERALSLSADEIESLFGPIE